jgi:Fibronectin type III domain
MANTKQYRASSISIPNKKIADVPDAPNSPTATDVGTSRAYNNGAASVTFTPAATGGAPTSFTVTSTPGSFSASGSSSPITVTGLQSGTAYTYAITATDSTATSPAGTSSSAVTATTVPQAPTIGTPTNATGQSYSGSASISVPFTAGATGGKSISTYTVTSSSTATATGSSSPISITESNLGTANTYTITATNANGTSASSSTSTAVTPSTVPQAPTIGSATDGGTGTTVSVAFTAGATGGSSITGYSIVSNPTTTTQSTSSSPYTFTGLTAGTSYTFQVAATNANGTSSYSSASNSVTPVVPSNFFSIATVTAAGGESSLTFSSIPSTYKSLQIRYLSKDSSTSSTFTNPYFLINGDSGSNYVYHFMRAGVSGGGPAASGQTPASFIQIALGGTTSYSGSSSMFGAGIVDIIDYTNTSKYKTTKMIAGSNENGLNTKDSVSLNSGVWLNTSTITSLTFYPGTSTFAAGSTFSLYGVS